MATPVTTKILNNKYKLDKKNLNTDSAVQVDTPNQDLNKFCESVKYERDNDPGKDIDEIILTSKFHLPHNFKICDNTDTKPECPYTHPHAYLSGKKCCSSNIQKNRSPLTFKSYGCYDKNIDGGTNTGVNCSTSQPEVKCKSACINLATLETDLENSRKELVKKCGHILFNEVGTNTSNDRIICNGNTSKFETIPSPNPLLDKTVGVSTLDSISVPDDNAEMDAYTWCKKKAIERGSLEFSIQHNKAGAWQNSAHTKNGICTMSIPGKKSCNLRIVAQNHCHPNTSVCKGGSIIESNANVNGDKKLKKFDMRSTISHPNITEMATAGKLRSVFSIDGF